MEACGYSAVQCSAYQYAVFSMPYLSVLPRTAPPPVRPATLGPLAQLPGKNWVFNFNKRALSTQF